MTHIPVHHPDDLARLYVRLRETRGTVKAQRIADSVGERCRKCGGVGFKSVLNAKKQRIDRCVGCDEVWDGEEINVLRQHEKSVRKPRGDDGGDFEVWRRVQPVIENRPRSLRESRWKFCLLSYLLFLDPTVGTYARAAEVGPEMLDDHWSPARVRGAVAVARNVIENRGERAGLIAGHSGPRAKRRMAQENDSSRA